MKQIKNIKLSTAAAFAIENCNIKSKQMEKRQSINSGKAKHLNLRK